MKHFYKILFFILFQIGSIFIVQAQTPVINIVRFNNTASYVAGSGVSVIINPTGVFNLNNQFVLELSNLGGVFPPSPTVLTTLDEFYVPVINGTLPSGLAAGTYKLRVRSTSPNIISLETAIFNVSAGGGIEIPSFNSGLPNKNTSFSNCLTDCTNNELNNFFGQLNVS